jgi:hypothetical protein
MNTEAPITDEMIANWTLAEYIDALNALMGDGFGLTDDLDHWAEYGITTAWGLAMHLDAEDEREREKEMRY